MSIPEYEPMPALPARFCLEKADLQEAVRAYLQKCGYTVPRFYDQLDIAFDGEVARIALTETP